MSDSEEPDDESRDESSRRRICDELDRNFLVEAAAGTGKTTSIVNRMVNLVADGVCRIDQLVAVTFTRKAAAELRERFHAELRHRAAELQPGGAGQPGESYLRLQSASDHVSRAFVGTIHSFCASLLRERPIEFDVDPAFRELDEQEDSRLREQAWQENINDLFASGDPLIDQIDELGIDRDDLRACYDRFIEYRDVENWPCSTPQAIDLDELQSETRQYVEAMKELLPLFPDERGNDKLMGRYEEIVRASSRSWSRTGDFFRLLERFDKSHGAVLSKWHDKAIAKQERDRFNGFRQTVVQPSLQWWCRKRYEFVVEFVRRAVQIYEQLKSASGGLDFTDVLLITARGLRTQPELRRYFRDRFTHLLVDEFQDTDPIQAELILLLTSEDVEETEWTRCRPRNGALFLVGDPKQSIYRFRRGDIVTYNRVKAIFEESGGEVLPLVRSFRSSAQLREWNNQVYREKFLDQADAYRTAAEDMVQGRVDASEGDLAGVRKLTLSPAFRIADTTRDEAESIARFIRNAVDAKRTVSRTQRELDLGRPRHVEPRDFLVIPRRKRHIDLFREALERYAIPCDVTGGNAIITLEPLQILVDCLKCVDDPQHSVHYLAILRDRLFAFNDAELYDFKKAGGRFSYTSEIPADLPPELTSRFEDANGRLRRYQQWLRIEPFPVAVNRIAADLGLLARAASERQGNLALGTFFKAIEGLRKQSHDFDSASDLLGYLQQVDDADESEGCSALPPDPNVVRVMNLHKAKGLEAPIVFLTDTSPPFRRPPVCHIDRSSDQPAGFMGITTTYAKYHTREVATPDDWESKQSEEQNFLDAEEDRLLYVATTRAACMMVVSIGKDNSNWSGLHKYLADASELEIPNEPPVVTLSQSPASQPNATVSATAGDEIIHRWQDARKRSYEIESAKESALRGAPRPDWHASGEYGYKWGMAVHDMLEVAKKAPSSDLRQVALALTAEHDLGHQRRDELLGTVRAVMQSDVWERSTRAVRCYSELPFETLSQTDDGRPLVTRGVIDLVFEEPDGWVIADYKTDDIEVSNLPRAVEHYAPQLRRYAEHWTHATDRPVKELGLYFTRIDRYVGV